MISSPDSYKSPALDVMFLLFFLMLFLLVGFRPLEFFLDTLNYLELLHNDFDFFEIEPSAWIIKYINSHMLGGFDRGFFLIYAFLGVGFKIYAIRNVSKYSMFSFFLYICFYLVLHEMTQIRVGVAAGLFLLALPNLVNKDYKGYFFKSFVAIFFHYSALLMLPLFFINVKSLNKGLYFLLPVLGFVLAINPDFVLDAIINVSSFFPFFIYNKVQAYFYLLSQGVYSDINVFNPYIVTLLFVYYFSLCNLSKFKFDEDIILVKILGIQIFLFFSLSSIPVFAFRLSEFFGICSIIMLAHFVLIFKEKFIPSFLIVIWSAAYFWFISINRLVLLNT